MARKDQVKLFFCACVEDDPLVQFVKESGVQLKQWAYVRAIKLWRNRIRELVESGVGNIEKQRKIAVNKALDLFSRVPERDLSIKIYLNFLLALAEDICSRVRKESEKRLWGKIIENLLKLYVTYDPELDATDDMEQGEMLNKIVWQIF
ncbi:hypothetical protein [Desulfovulcanus sp.]